MAKCEICGNDYDRALEIIVEGESHVFDSFECAIQGLAPPCPHCGCRVIGHGVEQKGQIFCCVHCARVAGQTVQLRLLAPRDKAVELQLRLGHDQNSDQSAFLRRLRVDRRASETT